MFGFAGFAYDKLIASSGGRAMFVALYCLANFFENFGPNTTTFIIPGEVFPTRYRATAHGISAASGKLGAVVVQLAFQWLKDVGGENKFLNHMYVRCNSSVSCLVGSDAVSGSLEIFAFFMFTGILSTMLIPETNQKTLEQLSNESQDDFIQRRSLSNVVQKWMLIELSRSAVPASCTSPNSPGFFDASGFQTAPIKLQPLESPRSPPTAYTLQGRRKGTSGSLTSHYASMSELSVSS